MIKLGAPEIDLLLYMSLFVGVLLVFEGLRQLATSGETNSESRNRRMRMISSGKSKEDVISIFADNSKASWASPIALIRQRMKQAGLHISPYIVLFLSAAIGAGTFFFLEPLLTSYIALPLSFVVGLGVPIAVLNNLAGARLKKLDTQLPEALDLMARGLKVGHPIAVTVESVAKDMPDPIGSEFGVILDQISYVDDVTSAFRQFADRTGIEDVRYLAVSIGIQHGTGGNLARILNVLSGVIRGRAAMRRKIKAIAAEGRMSSLILTVLPVFLFLSVYLSTPGFYLDVADDPTFKFLAVVAIGLVVLQAVLLRRMVNFKF